jgi:hypothetical protein
MVWFALICDEGVDDWLVAFAGGSGKFEWLEVAAARPKNLVK